MSETERIPVLCKCRESYIYLNKRIVTQMGRGPSIVGYAPPTPCDVCHGTIDIHGRDLKKVR